jgi:hypothetical protein
MSKALAFHGASIDFVVPYVAEHPGIDFMNIIPATDVELDAKNLYFGAYENGTPENPEADYGLSGMRAIQKRYGDFVEKLAKNKQIDAIHAHDWLTMEAGVRAKNVSDVPLIVHVHATEFDRSGEQYGNPLVHEIEQQRLNFQMEAAWFWIWKRQMYHRSFHLKRKRSAGLCWRGERILE